MKTIDTTKPVKPGIRERRYQQAVKDLGRLMDLRETLLDRLTRTGAKINVRRRQIARFERTLKPVIVEAPARTPEPTPAPATTPTPYKPGASMAAKIDDALHSDDQLEIPDFLRRAGNIGKMTPADLAAMAAIDAEQKERKRTKSHNRIATMNAKKSGETRRMPLEGKAALAKIRAGD
jgi:hypothetical protein